MAGEGMQITLNFTYNLNDVVKFTNSRDKVVYGKILEYSYHSIRGNEYKIEVEEGTPCEYVKEERIEAKV